MFKIAVTDGAPIGTELDAEYRLIAEAGFDGVDASIGDLLPYKTVRDRQMTAACSDEKTFLEAIRPYRTTAEKYGLENLTAHAPFPTCTWDSEYDGRLWEILLWYVHACDAINCRLLVVHPTVSFLTNPLPRQVELETTMALYRKLAPSAKQYGVTILTENMVRNRKYGKHTKPFESCCSDILEACAMLDALNAETGEERFGFCLDTGHLLMIRKDVDYAIAQLGSRLKALHIHDNNGEQDQHLPPYMGIQDWNRFTDGIAASDFRGTLTFETVKLWEHVPAKLLPAALRFLAETGRTFAAQIEEKRAGI